MTLNIGLSVDPSMPRFLDVARQAERIGVDSVWVAEYWAFDAFTPLAAIASVTERLRLATGIAQLGARTPAMLAMTAQGVQQVSDGRLILGIGTSGPQVMEGWHGVPFERPVQRTRETIEIVRMITAGDRLAYDGSVYQLPLPDSAGRAIRSRAEVAPIPIYVASLGPANLSLTGELADGWIGNSFFTDSASAFFDPIAGGAAKAGRSLDDVDRVVAVVPGAHRRRPGGDRGGGPTSRRRVRVHVRGDGHGEQELLQRRVRTPGLSATTSKKCGGCGRQASGTRRQPECRPRSVSAPTSSARPTGGSPAARRLGVAGSPRCGSTWTDDFDGRSPSSRRCWTSSPMPGRTRPTYGGPS